MPAPVDHLEVIGTCASCHNGSTATGKNPSHIQSTSTCDDCHNTNAWIPAVMDHTSAIGTCASCHNGSSATGKPASHFVTTVECDQCHTTNAWIPTLNYSHFSGSYPGDHGGSLACATCHPSNSQVVAWSSPAYKPDCAGCHAGDYESGDHDKYGSINYNVSELRDCAGSCHIYTDSSLSTISRTRNSQHRVSDSGW
ncbi:MAG: cytochrome c3 family protein [Thermodesulfobacteriota bacterium]